MKLYIALFLICFIVPQKRIINTQDFGYEFYISLEKIENPKSEKTYFWYKSGEIHQSRSDIGGDVLVNDYTKYYKSKQLAEKGIFDNGLKDGVWKSWHTNGNLATIEKWQKDSGMANLSHTLKTAKRKLKENIEIIKNTEFG